MARRRRRRTARKPRVPKVLPSILDFTSLSRPDTTAAVTEYVQRYWIEKGFSCHPEMGLTRGGRLRADVFALNTKGETVLVEVKSCWADLSTDLKWEQYRLYANKFFFAVSEHFYEKDGARIWDKVKEHAGVLVVEASGKVKVKHRAKEFKVHSRISRRMLTRCAWRGGRFTI